MHRRRFALLAAAYLALGTGAHAAQPGADEAMQRIADAAIQPMMADNDVPGVAVGITVSGKQFVFSYGVADKATGRKVTASTVFEIGSLSKTFTATLGADALVEGKLSLADPASNYLPALRGSALDRVTLLELATFTAGGLPLQFPDAVTNDSQMLAYFTGWKGDFSPGAQRLYSNPSIGLFGYLAAKSLGASFNDLMQHEIVGGLGLRHTFLKVPPAEMGNYAFGYTKDNRPIRVAPGVFDAEAYGIKSTVGDMLRFVDANMGAVPVDPTLGRAIAATHVAYYQVGPLLQGMGWEQVRYPTTLDSLLAANSSDMAYQPHPATALASGTAPTDVLLNKTGSTNGFGAYAAFLPGQKLGVVILANKNVPIPARVKAAYAILSALPH